MTRTTYDQPPVRISAGAVSHVYARSDHSAAPLVAAVHSVAWPPMNWLHLLSQRMPPAPADDALIAEPCAVLTIWPFWYERCDSDGTAKNNPEAQHDLQQILYTPACSRVS